MKEYEENSTDEYVNDEVSTAQEEEIAFNATLDKEKLDSIIIFINNTFKGTNNRKTELINFRNLVDFVRSCNYKISILESEKILDNCPKLEETLDLIYDKVDNTSNTSIQSLLSSYSSRKFEEEENEKSDSFELSDQALFGDRYNEHGINLMDLYFNEIAQYRKLTIEEEKELGYRIQAGDKKAYDELVNCNLKLAVHFAKSYIYSGLVFSDLIQAGNEGLLKAVSRFDPSKGFKFSTYATWWIKQSIQRTIADTGRIIRIPVHQHEVIFKIKKEIAIFKSSNNGESPSNEYLSDALDLPLEKVEFCRQLMNDVTSLSTPVGEEGDSELGDFIEDINSNPDDTLNLIYYTEFKKAFENTTCLTTREREVLKYRNGFYNNRIYTLEEVGEKLNVTRERIRQIEKKALRKLARNTEIKKFNSDEYKPAVKTLKVFADRYTDESRMHERRIQNIDRYNSAYNYSAFSTNQHEPICLKLK